jgi:MerR family transcriptional regulator/heat shock protein HspR
MADPSANRPQGSRTTAVYVISVAAELAGLHPQTLRIYERKGLLDPARTGGGSRRYSDADIAQLRRIQELTSEGLNLAGVQRVLELEAEVDALRQRLANERAGQQAAVERTHRQYRRDLVPLNQSVVVFRDR